MNTLAQAPLTAAERIAMSEAAADFERHLDDTATTHRRYDYPGHIHIYRGTDGVYPLYAVVLPAPARVVVTPQCPACPVEGGAR